MKRSLMRAQLRKMGVIKPPGDAAILIPKAKAKRARKAEKLTRDAERSADGKHPIANSSKIVETWRRDEAPFFDINQGATP